MLIADAQIHVWKAGDPKSKIINPPYPPLSHPSFSKDDVLEAMDGAGVQRVVLVPPGWDVVSGPDDHNTLALEAARLHPDRFSVAGLLQVDSPESPSLIERWKSRPGMRAMRATFTSSGNRLRDGSGSWLWPAAEKANIPIMIRTTDETQFVANIAEKHPGLKLAIDHMALKHFATDEAATIYIPQLLALAKQPNVTVKASALPVYSSELYPYTNLHKYIRQVFDAFGPDRMFWGSDLTRLRGSYKDCINLFVEELRWLSQEDKEKVMGKTLCNWLEWPIP